MSEEKEPREVLSAASAEALELPRLLASVAELACSDLGRKRFASLAPASTGEELARRRRRYRESERLLIDGPTVPSMEIAYRPLLDRLAEGEPLEGPEIVQLAALLATSEEALKRIREDPEGLPELTSATGEIASVRSLLSSIRSALDRRGEVRDDASPELARLRRSIQRVRDGLYRDLRRSMQEHAEQIAEETIPLREGRLVLVVQAGSRGRMKGLVHGRSGSGRSLYFEPLEAVEGNNRLQQELADEAAEKARILAELSESVRQHLGSIEDHARLLAELDLQQAAWRFAEACEGVLPDEAPAGELRLIDARHPLLDPQLADLRRRALGTEGNRRPIVPLDLELDADRRLLVITGPNAGGKTVALKTVGLLALASQCGLPIPAMAGSRLPDFGRVVAVVGDEQDLLSDRSTFSGRLLRLAEAWEKAGPDSLVLLDELGSGTDPEEGAALATALLEELLARRGLALLTTHLVPVAAAALEREGAGCAAMEFEASSGEPTYHLLPGPPGGSEAVALARRLGLARSWIDRAEELLGSDYRDLRQMLDEVEAVRRSLLDQQMEAQRETLAVRRQREQIADRLEQLEQERRAVGKRARKDLDRYRQQVRSQLAAAERAIREELAQGRRKGVVRRAEREAFGDISEPELARIEPEAEGELVEGGRVRHRSLGWEGTLLRLDSGRAEVGVGGKRLRCRGEELVPIAEAPTEVRRPRPTERLEEEETSAELNLIGQRVEPALEELERFLDRAMLNSLDRVRVVHGHGTGRLRTAVRERLRRHPGVGRYRPGERNEGGDGATVVQMAAEKTA